MQSNPDGEQKPPETEAPADLLEELKELFERADFVKFAKFTADDEDNAKALPVAVRFVTSTYQAELEDNSPESLGGENDDETVVSDAASVMSSEAGTSVNQETKEEA